MEEVNLFRLEEGNWVSKGIGTVSIDANTFLEIRGQPAEESGQVSETGLLYRTNIIHVAEFKIDQDSLIMFVDEGGNEMAISFRNSETCLSMLESINKLRIVRSDLNGEKTEQVYDRLPACETKNLEAIQQAISSAVEKRHDANAKNDRDMREQALWLCNHLGDQITMEHYIPKFVEYFVQWNDYEDDEMLRVLYLLFRDLLLLCQSAILEELVDEKNIMAVFGALENPPEKPKAHYVEFLKTARLQQVVPFRDPQVAPLIRKIFHLQYLKDVVFAGSIDDQLVSVLTSYIQFTNAEVVDVLKADESFMGDLVHVLAQPEATSLSRLTNALQLTSELCTLALASQRDLTSPFLDILKSLGIFECMPKCLGHESSAVRGQCAGVLLSFVQADLCSVRAIIVDQAKKHERSALLSALIRAFATEKTPSTLLRVYECLRYILDPMLPIPQNAANKDQFLMVFYEPENLNTLVSCLNHVPSATFESRQAELKRKECGCSLFGLCISAHANHARSYFLRTGVLVQLVSLLNDPNPFVALAYVRLIRSIVATKNKFYVDHLIRANIFDPIIARFKASGNRYNVFNSTVVELLDFIKKESRELRDLIVHLVRAHRDYFASLTYVSTFGDLILRHDQHEEFLSNADLDETAHLSSFQEDRRNEDFMDREEEDYFDRAVDQDGDLEECPGEEETSPVRVTQSVSYTFTPPPRRPLVAYEEDEEDDFVAKIQSKNKS